MAWWTNTALSTELDFSFVPSPSPKAHRTGEAVGWSRIFFSSSQPHHVPHELNNRESYFLIVRQTSLSSSPSWHFECSNFSTEDESSDVAKSIFIECDTIDWSWWWYSVCSSIICTQLYNREGNIVHKKCICREKRDSLLNRYCFNSVRQVLKVLLSYCEAFPTALCNLHIIYTFTVTTHLLISNIIWSMQASKQSAIHSSVMAPKA